MKKIIKGIVLSLVAVVIVIVGGAYILPGEAKVDRAMVINVPPEKVFAIAGDMKRFNEWSPWYALDPKTTYTFEGSAGAVGQKMTWASNDPNVGKGSQTITEIAANERIVTELDMGEMGKAMSTIALAAVDGGTSVTWEFKAGLSGVMERWMGLLYNKWVGGDYEKGLSNLKVLAEKESPDA